MKIRRYGRNAFDLQTRLFYEGAESSHGLDFWAFLCYHN